MDRYWKKQKTILTERMAGKDKGLIIESLEILKERMIGADKYIVNATTKLNYEDDIKPSANVKEASYLNIFECGRNLLDKLDVTYQRAFTASVKNSR